MKSFLRRMLPKRWLALRANAEERHRHKKYRGLSAAQVFSRIYADQEWGSKVDAGFYSGRGSHDPDIVAPYLQAVRDYLLRLQDKPVIVDLGCGDFNVGKHFVELAKKYYACDIVPELQEQNRKIFSDKNLQFLCANIIEEPLPDGDVVFIRQVLQHLSNAQISEIIRKCAKYDAWIVTEHLPSGESFLPNIDISAGSGIRLLQKSGVVLTAPPFNMNGYRTTVLCQIPFGNDVIRTTLFERTPP